jgi:hypothetical protein
MARIYHRAILDQPNHDVVDGEMQWQFPNAIYLLGANDDIIVREM